MSFQILANITPADSALVNTHPLNTIPVELEMHDKKIKALSYIVSYENN
jgi:hypothetical protein